MINAATNTVSAILPTVGMANAVSFTPDGRRAFVPEGGPKTVNHNGLVELLLVLETSPKPGPGEVRVFDTHTHRVLGVIPAGDVPGNVAIAGS